MKFPFALTGLCAISLISFGLNGSADAKSGGDTDIKAEVVKTRPLMERRRTPVVIRLDHEGTNFPVMPEELETVLNSKVHVYGVDPALSDYHHKNPYHTNNPGQYIFTMTPHTSCGYGLWIDIDAKGDGRQFIKTELPGKEDCKGAGIDRTPSLTSESGGYTLDLSFDTKGLQAGRKSIAKIMVRETGGSYEEGLQPYMGGYAHLIGFYADSDNVLRTKPLADEPTSWSDRGGPAVEFEVMPEHNGFVKFFAQFKVGDKVFDASFGAYVGGGVAQYSDAGAWQDDGNSADDFGEFGLESDNQPVDEKPVQEKRRPTTYSGQTGSNQTGNMGGQDMDSNEPVVAPTRNTSGDQLQTREEWQKEKDKGTSDSRADALFAPELMGME